MCGSGLCLQLHYGVAWMVSSVWAEHCHHLPFDDLFRWVRLGGWLLSFADLRWWTLWSFLAILTLTWVGSLHAILYRCHCVFSFWRPLLASGIRYGEALHPGPPHGVPDTSTFTFLVTNPTALHQKAGTYMDLAHCAGAHFVGASETSATMRVQNSFASQMRRWKWRSCFSGPAPDHRLKADGGDSLRGKAVGTAAFSMLPLRAVRDQLPDQWRDSLRLLHVVLSLGVLQIQVLIMYGLVAPVQGSATYNNAMMDAAIQASSRLPLPAIFMGGFNMDVHRLHGVQQLQKRGYSTLQQCYLQRYGKTMPPTCKESTTPDTAILPPELLGGLTEINVLNEGHWFDAHHPVAFSITLPGQQITRQVLPRPQPLTDFMFDSDAINDAWEDLQGGPQPTTFEEWASLMEDTFDVALRKMPVATGLPRSLPLKYRGRCRPREPKQRPVHALLSFARPGEFQPAFEIHTMRTKALVKQLRRIVSLKRHKKKFGGEMGNSSASSLMTHEWNAICRFWYQGACFVNWMQFWPELCPVPWNVPDFEWLHDLQQLVQYEVNQCLYHDQVAWEKKQAYFRLQDKRLQNSRDAFRFVRGHTSPLHEVCQKVSQQALSVMQPDFSFVELWCEDPSKYALDFAATFDGHPCRILEICDRHLMASFDDNIGILAAEGELAQLRSFVEPRDIFAQLTDYWLPLWQRDETDALADPEIANDFANYLGLLDPYRCQLDPDLNSPELWEQAVHKLRTRSSPGFDGVRAAELQLLPRDLLFQLQFVFAQYPQGFPPERMAARTVPLPKVDALVMANQVRPITILSQLYRLWAALICQQVLRTWAPLLPADITGLLARRSSFQAAYALQWELELAKFEHRQSAGLTLDICKCFNMLSQPRGFLLLERMGLAPSIIAQWKGSLACMTRRWELFDAVSPVMAASCGFPEGDIFSVLVMIVTALTWTLAIRNEVGTSPMLSAYADNWTWSSPVPRLFEGILTVTLGWVSQMGLLIDWAKTWCWATSQDLYQSLCAALRRLNAPVVLRVCSASDLGCPMRYQGAPRLGKLKGRLKAGRTRLLRIKDSGEELSTKITLVSQGVYASALYGSEFLPLGEKHLETMRSLVASALIGDSRCATPCLVLLLASPRLRDPGLHVILQACAAARRFLWLAPDTVQRQFLACAAAHKPMPNASKGPASTLSSYLVRLGWTLTSDGYLWVTAFRRVSLMQIPWEQLVYYADLAWQDRLLQCHAAKHSLAHLPNLSRADGLFVLRSFNDKEKVLLLREISGAYLTHEQQSVWDDQQTPLCSHCGQIDSRAHRVYECPALVHVRDRHQQAVLYAQEMDTDWHLLPAALEHPQTELRDMLQHRFPEASFDETLCGHVRRLVDAGVRLNLFTDGSCRHPSFPGLRYASYAIVLDSCIDDEERCHWARLFKTTGAIPPTLHTISQAMCTGPQSIHRAELFALVRVAETFSGVTIFADSASALSAYHRAPTLALHELHSQPHLDLVLRLRQIPHLHSNLACKIKAHQIPASLPDLDCYLALGNEMADRAANAAFDTCAGPLVADWEKHFVEETDCFSALTAYYKYLVALQPERIHLCRHGGVDELALQASSTVEDMHEALLQWRPSPAWRPLWPSDDTPTFWEYGTWGKEVTSWVADWLLRCVWPTEMPEAPPGNLGYSWVEATLSLCMWMGCIPPVRRRDSTGAFVLRAMPDFLTAMAEGVTLTELALQCSTLIMQTVQLSPVVLLPAFVERRRIKSLYLQGFPIHAYGWSVRPVVPNQQPTQSLMQQLRQAHYGATSWGFLPPEVFLREGFRYVEELSWEARLERLKGGVRLARQFRG